MNTFDRSEGRFKQAESGRPLNNHREAIAVTQKSSPGVLECSGMSLDDEAFHHDLRASVDVALLAMEINHVHLDAPTATDFLAGV